MAIIKNLNDENKLQGCLNQQLKFKKQKNYL